MAAQKIALLVVLLLVGIFSSVQGFRATDYSPPWNGMNRIVCDYACDSVQKIPVCDNFGNQYPNVCELYRIICLSKKAYGIHFVMYEVPCDLPVAPTEVAPITKKPNYWLARFCSVDDPVCDTLGNMYPNRCKFHVAQKANPDLKLSDKKPQDGSCEGAVEEVPEQPDVQPGEPVCELPCVTPEFYDGFCDQHGFFHSTSCHFENAKCKDSSLRKAPCPGTQSGDLTIDPSEIFTCEKPCSETFAQAVCDQHSRFYQSLCFFENAKCKDPSLKQSRCPPGIDASNSLPSNPSRTCQKSCSWKTDFVCDQFGGFHLNPCKFQNAKCDNPDLKRIPCRPVDPTNVLPPPPNPPKKKSCSKTGCYPVDDPVCDQYGKTYQNACELAKFQECHYTDAKLAPCPKFRSCSKVGCFSTRENDGPVCDQNGKVYKNYCALFYEQQCGEDVIETPCPQTQPQEVIETDTDPPITTKCEFADPCPPGAEPVCDQLGRKYKSHCDFEHVRLCGFPVPEMRDMKVAPCPTTEPPKLKVCTMMGCPITENSGPVCDQNGKYYNNSCELFYEQQCGEDVRQAPCPNPPKPKSCTREGCWPGGEPVCDQYGKTYENACRLKKFQDCYYTDVRKAQCPETDPPKAVDPKACIMIGCLPEQENSGPVCDQNGKYYNSSCELFYEQQCGEDVKETPCPFPPKVKICTKEECMPGGEPVCDQYGTKYENACRLKKFQECYYTDVREAPCPYSPPHFGCTVVGCHALEPEKPICDQNGIVYQSYCEIFYKEQCGEVIKQVPCPQFESQEIIETPPNPPKSKSCATMETCPSTAEPVCNQFGQKYKNMCEFEYYQCSYPDMKEAPCPWDPSEPLRVPEACEVECGSERRTVCDQYANTYRNSCEFENARCQDPNLQKSRCPAKPKKHKTKKHKKWDLLTFMKKFYKKFLKGTEIGHL